MDFSLCSHSYSSENLSDWCSHKDEGLNVPLDEEEHQPNLFDDKNSGLNRNPHEIQDMGEWSRNQLQSRRDSQQWFCWNHNYSVSRDSGFDLPDFCFIDACLLKIIGLKSFSTVQILKKTKSMSNKGTSLILMWSSSLGPCDRFPEIKIACQTHVHISLFVMTTRLHMLLLIFHVILPAHFFVLLKCDWYKLRIFFSLMRPSIQGETLQLFSCRRTWNAQV